jgi:hypothetical protein
VGSPVGAATSPAAPQWTVAVDGALFARNLDFVAGNPLAEPANVGFDRWMRQALQELDQPCNLVLARDAAALGAAILAGTIE